MLRVNLHTHVCQAPVAAMVGRAAELGMAVLGLSEHIYQLREGRALAPDAFTVEEGRLFGVDEYLHLADGFRGTDGPRLLVGMEVDWLDGRMGPVAAFLKEASLDFTLGSVHQIRGWELHTDPDGAPCTGLALWRRYVDLQVEAVLSGLFDALCHPVRLGVHVPFPGGSALFARLYRPLLEAAREAGIPLEVNAVDVEGAPGLSRRLFQLCREEGVRVVLGTDAHRPEDLTYRAALLARWADEMGGPPGGFSDGGWLLPGDARGRAR